jgi:DNA polymerase-3 subunit beta
MSKVSFIADQKTLINVLASMQPICSKKTTLDVTEYILFHITPRELTLKATDLEISLRSSVEIEETTTENTSFLVSGKRIFELVRELHGAISFSLINNQLKLNCAGVDLALNIRNVEDFPPFPERIENLMEINAELLLTLLGRVSFLIPQNHSNAALNGLLLEFSEEGMSMTSTDGHCLVQVKSAEYKLPEHKKWLLPKRAVLELKKLLEGATSKEVFLGICGSQLVFSGMHFNFFTKLIADQFPEYKPILNKTGFMPAKLAKNDMLKALKRANCFLAGQFLSTKFIFQKGSLALSLKNKDVGTMEESLSLTDFSGDAVESRFYSPYLLNGISVFPDNDVVFSIKSIEKPIIFESTQEKYHFTYLVMPVSVAAKE